MSGLTRYIRILRLFDDVRGERTIADMSTALSLPTSTIYRTVRDMMGAGLLEAAEDSRYRLGCCFIEFDQIIRVTDPLYVAGAWMLRELVVQARVPCAATISRLYGDTVMCIADAATPGGDVYSDYRRGRPRPLTRGATSKAILAQLPSRHLTRLLSQDTGETQPPFAKVTTAEIRKELQLIRQRGYSITHGEIDKGFVGIAAPVSINARRIVGSLGLVVKATGDGALERRLAMLVVSTASLLAEQIADTVSTRSLPGQGLAHG